MSSPPVTFLPRDYVEAPAGLLFAVVAHGLEADRVLAFLRYVRDRESWRKVATNEAHALLRSDHPQYLFHSTQRDVLLHGVPLQRIVRHYSPRARLAELLRQGGGDPIEEHVRHAARLLGDPASTAHDMGVTGSVLIGAQQASSDIDLVMYDLTQFHRARERLRAACQEGLLQPLDEAAWRETYRRRGCSLTFPQYVWHERRKWNKCLLAGTKVDLSCVTVEPTWSAQRGCKLQRRNLRTTVIDDQDAFAYPARYLVQHSEVDEIVAYNPTYTGQAMTGEKVEAAGWLEQLADNRCRLLVGTSREAEGEYIRVI
jgi:predicted nucleotidyltransferase